jgi:FlaA1/EpsC-like NDP-sugar epimerase
MGEPVRIVDLARDLIRLSGYREDAVEIQYVGLRAGERLHETLFNGSETDEPTPDPRILRASSAEQPPDTLERLRNLVALARQRRVAPGDVVELAQELGGAHLLSVPASPGR